MSILSFPLKEVNQATKIDHYVWIFPGKRNLEYVLFLKAVTLEVKIYIGSQFGVNRNYSRHSINRDRIIRGFDQESDLYVQY